MAWPKGARRQGPKGKVLVEPSQTPTNGTTLKARLCTILDSVNVKSFEVADTVIIINTK